jgi:anti-anti-sigma factor
MSNVTHEDLGDNVRRIVLNGRLDTVGVNEMSDQLRELASVPKRGVIVDLTGVPFLGSMGIGQLIQNAQAVKSRGGHMVLIAVGSSSVMTSLKMAGIDTLIPIFDNPSDAFTAAMRGF